MRQALVLKTSQNLMLTPQLRQSIKLLSMSTLELSQEIQLAIESNPFVEDAEFADGPDELVADGTSPESQAETAEAPADNSKEVSAEAEVEATLDLGTENGGSYQGEEFESQDAVPTDLRDHLRWQVEMSPFTRTDAAIALAIIDAIDDDGYLRESESDLQQALHPEFVVEVDEIEAVRHRLQRFDPVGVASRSLQECLSVQLCEFDCEADPDTALATRIVHEALDLLGRGDLCRLSEHLGISRDQAERALVVIRTLNPRPGDGYSAAREEVVIPEVYVRKVGPRYEVKLNPQCSRPVRLSQTYQGLMHGCSGNDASYLKGQLQEARWLLKSLQQREVSVLKVARAIVAEQQDFLERGAIALKPMVMREIADQVGLHESTISRIAARKYMHTPIGLFEFRYFFSSHVSTSDGGEASARAIQAMIKKLIDAEIPEKPLSDQSLANQLKDQGMLVARRTVAKYREQLGIPPSSDRVRLR